MPLRRQVSVADGYSRKVWACCRSYLRLLEVSQQETLDQFTYTRGKVYCEPEVISEKAFSLWFTYCMSHRMVHAFTAAGLLTQQYLSFCRLARLGVVGKRYIYQSKFVYVHVCTCTMHMFVTIRFSIWCLELLGSCSTGG